MKHNVQLEQQFIDHFNEAGFLGSGENFPIEHGLIVGAPIQEIGEISFLGEQDANHLGFGLSVCKSMGIDVSKDFQISTCDKKDGSNFLEDYKQIEPDLLVFGYVDYDPLANEADQWHQALVGSNPRFCINIHTNDIELPIEVINRDPYQHLFRAKALLGDMTIYADFLARADVVQHYPEMQNIISSLDKGFK